MRKLLVGMSSPCHLIMALLSVSVESDNVIRIIIQYLLDAGLCASAESLQRESQVFLNAMSESQLNQWIKDIVQARWDAVLKTISHLEPDTIPPVALWLLVELISTELAASKQFSVALRLIETCRPFLLNHQSKLVKRIEKLSNAIDASAATSFSLAEYYNQLDAGSDDCRRQRRLRVAEKMRSVVPVAPKDRLLELCGEALQSQCLRICDSFSIAQDKFSLDIFRGLVLMDKQSDVTEGSNRFGLLSQQSLSFNGCLAQFTKSSLLIVTAQHLLVGNSLTGIPKDQCAIDLDYRITAMTLATSSSSLDRVYIGTDTGAVLTWTESEPTRIQKILSLTNATRIVKMAVFDENLILADADGNISIWQIASTNSLLLTKILQVSLVKADASLASGLDSQSSAFDSHRCVYATDMLLMRDNDRHQNTLLYATSNHGFLYIWDLETKSLTSRISPFAQCTNRRNQSLVSVCLKESSQLAVTNQHGFVAVLSKSGKLLYELEGRSDPVVSTRHNDRYVFLAHESGIIRRLDLMQDQAKLISMDPVLAEHLIHMDLYSLGNRIACLDASGNCSLWSYS